jgi:hypothetical protein
MTRSEMLAQLRRQGMLEQPLKAYRSERGLQINRAYARAYAQGASGVWDGNLHALTQAPDVQAAIKAATKTGANRATVDGFPAIKNPFAEVNGKLHLIQKADGSVAYPSLQFWDHVQRNLRGHG